MPTQPDELAVFSGVPTFAEPLHVGRPNVPDRTAFMKRVEDILDRRWLSNAGKYVQEFESRVAARVGVRHCIAVCNGTVALEIAARALGMKGEVIVPSFTFVATAHALQWLGIQPVFADVDAQTHCISPASVEKLVTDRTSGIIGVHVWGRPCDVHELGEIAARRGLRLLYDASHAFGCSSAGRMLGRFGDAEVFSFHATKFVNCLEGGAIVTDNDELAARMRLMKNFGFAGYDRVVCLGTNGKMDEVSAAAGITGLENMGDLVAVNRANYDRYAEELRGLAGLTLTRYNAQESNNFQYVVVEVSDDECPLTRDELVEVLWAENVRARKYFYPGCHRMEPYQSQETSTPVPLPVTESLASRVFQLPTGTVVDPATVGRICRIIRSALEQDVRVRCKLGEPRGVTNP
jgi:dTDP-4-amino-4,6-dideoxygalactose transaminase